jgi:hypothetical protein
MLPNFIIIGAMKSGTTSLHRYMKMHPQIGMAEIKETNFFLEDTYSSKSVEWYKSQFEGDYKIYGEASPNYTKAHYFAGVPERMYNLVPEVKLIYLLRDPVERVISHYTHNLGAGRESKSMVEAFRDEQKLNYYVNSSRYYWQIQKYLEYYQKKQILIISSNELRNDRANTLKKVFEFLEVDLKLNKDNLHKEFGRTSRKTKKGKLGRLILNNFLVDRLKKNISVSFKRKAKTLLLPSLKKPSDISITVKSKLEKLLKSDAESLRSFSGLPFEGWSV